MSAPQIPNINSHRRVGGKRGVRGRGAGFNGEESSHEANYAAKDRVIQNTDNDAASSRLSAAEAGYFEDPFVKILAHGADVDKRLPLMNRGWDSQHLLC